MAIEVCLCPIHSTTLSGNKEHVMETVTLSTRQLVCARDSGRMSLFKYSSNFQLRGLRFICFQFQQGFGFSKPFENLTGDNH